MEQFRLVLGNNVFGASRMLIEKAEKNKEAETPNPLPATTRQAEEALNEKEFTFRKLYCLYYEECLDVASSFSRMQPKTWQSFTCRMCKVESKIPKKQIERDSYGLGRVAFRLEIYDRAEKEGKTHLLKGALLDEDSSNNNKRRNRETAESEPDCSEDI